MPKLPAAGGEDVPCVVPHSDRVLHAAGSRVLSHGALGGAACARDSLGGPLPPALWPASGGAALELKQSLSPKCLGEVRPPRWLSPACARDVSASSSPKSSGRLSAGRPPPPPLPELRPEPLRPRRVNVSGMGQGAYRQLYLQAVEASGESVVLEDAADLGSDLYLIVPIDREALHRRLQRLRAGSRVNHFPGMIDVCEKVSFARAMRQCLPLCPRLASYLPETWILPEEYGAVVQMLSEPGFRAFIVKPEYGLQGHGIFLIRTLVDLQVALHARGLCYEGGPRYVCQHYLERPLLLDGFKFDFRIYVVLTSLAPLEAHLCREGLARFCATRYAAPSSTNLSKVTGHLTNYALNSKQEGFARTEDGTSEEDASKRLLTKTLQQVAQQSGGRFSEARFWEQVEEITSLVLTAIMPVLAYTTSQYFPVNEAEPSRCYHVLGLDVLLDSDYWPWLLEVNSSPAMDIETAVPVPDAARLRKQPRETSKPGAAAAAEALASRGRRGGSSSSAAAGPSDSVRRSASNMDLRTRARSPRRGKSSTKRLAASEGSAALASAAGADARTDPSASARSASERPSAQGEADPLAAPLLGLGLSPSPAEAQPAPEALPASEALRGEPPGEGPPTPRPSSRKPKRKRTKRPPKPKEPEPEPPKYTDPWDGYQLSKLRHRAPFPETCYCVAHGLPHQHAVCEVDSHAKTIAMSGAYRAACGAETGREYRRVPFAPELLQLHRTLYSFVELCTRFSVLRDGVSGGTVRKVLQASEEVSLRLGVRGGRLGQHEIDQLLVPRGSQADPLSFVRQRHLETKGTSAVAYAELSALMVFGMLQDVSRKICEKDPELCGYSPLERLDWILQALHRGLQPSDASSRPALPPARGGRR